MPSNSTGGGWTSFSIDGAGGHRSTGGNPDHFFILNAAGGFPDPTIEQSVGGFTVGATYSVLGDYRAVYVPQSGGTPGFGVLLDGAPILQLGGDGTFNWRPFQIDFVATNTNHLLGFAAERNATDFDYGVDNLRILFVIPEPASIALAGVAGIGICALVRRRA